MQIDGSPDETIRQDLQVPSFRWRARSSSPVTTSAQSSGGDQVATRSGADLQGNDVICMSNIGNGGEYHGISAIIREYDIY